MSNHTFNENSDSTATVPVLIYTSKAPLENEYTKKMTLWLQQRLAKKDIELYRRPLKAFKKMQPKKVVQK